MLLHYLSGTLSPSNRISLPTSMQFCLIETSASSLNPSVVTQLWGKVDFNKIYFLSKDS